jgi:hypothetical protein
MNRFDSPAEGILRDAAALRSETHLTLGNLISYLEYTDDHPVANLTSPPLLPWVLFRFSL